MPRRRQAADLGVPRRLDGGSAGDRGRAEQESIVRGALPTIVPARRRAKSPADRAGSDLRSDVTEDVSRNRPGVGHVTDLAWSADDAGRIIAGRAAMPA